MSCSHWRPSSVSRCSGSAATRCSPASPASPAVTTPPWTQSRPLSSPAGPRLHLETRSHFIPRIEKNKSHWSLKCTLSHNFPLHFKLYLNSSFNNPSSDVHLICCVIKVNGGFYADPETGCQAFHVCTDDGQGDLRKVSFLCPNGTLFQQEYFTCDWWFNVDCTRARSLWSLNTELARQRAAHTNQL